MPRLAATEKMGFFSLPDRITDLIVRVVKLAPASGHRTLLDVCAGEGVALARLARAWCAEPFAVELSEARAAECAKRVPRTLCGSYQQLQAPDGFASIAFINPPYTNDGAHGGRQECQFIEHSTHWLAIGGLLVAVIPEHILGLDAFESSMGPYRLVVPYRFPDPEYYDFSQVVVFAVKKRDGEYSGGYTHYISDPIAILGCETYPLATKQIGLALPETPSPAYFRLAGICPEHWSPLGDPYSEVPAPTGVYDSDSWRTLTADNGRLTDINPLLPLRGGHVAQLLAAGHLDGTEITDHGQPVLIKGSSEKIVVVTEDPAAGKRYETERIVSRLSTLNTRTGELCTFRLLIGPELAAAVRTNFPPAFDPGPIEHWSGWEFDGARPPSDRPLPGRSVAEVLPKQKQVIAAVAHRWKRHKAAVISGEPATGKTTMATAATILSRSKKTIVLCPTHIVEKWCRQILAVAGSKAVIPKKLADIDRFFADPSAKFLVLGKEYAKCGAPWRHAAIRRTRTEIRERLIWQDFKDYPYSRRVALHEKVRVAVFSCPACGETICNGKTAHEDRRPVDENWFGTKKTKKKRKCPECGEPLWQYLWLTKKSKRWPPAKYISKRYARRYVLVADEVHSFASADSDQAQAMQQLASAGTRLLAMSGTVYKGRASTLFHLLHRIDPSFRNLYSHDETRKFVEDHGLLQRVYDIDDSSSAYGYRRGNSGGRVREVPGCSPAMVGLLLDYTAFVMLDDLGLKLPDYREEVESIQCDPKVLRNVRTMQSDARAELHRHPELLGQYLAAALGYPDCPEHAEAIGNDVAGIVATAPADLTPLGGWPKDKRLIEMCLADKRAGRKAIVFFPQVGLRDPQPRVKALLEEAGLRVDLMRSTVSSIKREGWIARHEPAFDVLLTNATLIETGLDLIWARHIIVAGIYYSIPTIRQAIRRSFRPEQTKPIVVTFLGYAGTMQETALRLIAKKTRASHQIEGDAGFGLAEYDDGGDDLLMELAREASGLTPACLARKED